MWRKVVTPRLAGQPVAQPVAQPTAQPKAPVAQAVAQPTNPIEQREALNQLLLPRPHRTLSLAGRRSFWARTSPGSTTRAACFFQHVSATTWLRAS
jgi:hypothetical protein